MASDDADARLVAGFHSGLPYKAIGRNLGMSKYKVSERLIRLGYRRYDPARWWPRVARLARRGLSDERVAAILGKSKSAVAHARRSQGVPSPVKGRPATPVSRGRVA